MRPFIYLFIYLFITHSFAQCWQQISASPFNLQGSTNGANCNAGIKTDGTLWTWGNNSDGQLGDGTTTNRAVPTEVGTDTDWVWVSAGTNAMYAIKQNGTLWAWGSNNHGQLSDGTTTSRLLPALVLSGTTWSKVSAGDGYVVAQKTDGTLWSCGLNSFEQLGIPAANNETTNFLQVSPDTDWLDFTCGVRQTVLLKTNHTYWCWGAGTYGVLATGSTAGSYYPINPLTNTDWTQVTTNYGSSLFRKINGTLWGVGYNQYGTLGLGNTTNSYYTVQQLGTATDWGSLVSSAVHTMAIKNNGTLWSCGLNVSGQLGNGTTTDTNTLAQVGTATNWAKVRCGRLYTLALDSNGSLWAWGDNSSGQLGDGTTTNRLVPTPIGTACTTMATSNYTKSTMHLLNNPVTNFIQLAFDRDGTKEIAVYNSLGVLLDTKTISSDFSTIDVSGYASGLYFVSCKIDGAVQTVKVVKE